MAALTDPLRSSFEREVIKARDEAEKATQAALTTLAVERGRPFDAISEEKRALRRALRARARQLGEGDMPAGIPRLIEEIAYAGWHRMLFARFLAENNLLMHPEGVPATLEECAELAQEEGAEDLWEVATRYASMMLPGIFRVDDPALQVRFAPEGRYELEQIVTDLPRAVFTSDDGLGWAYQFWQSKKKDEVNASERKIGGADIAPVTQLFTEDYMVKFLLHNTLGAWWAYRHPDSPLNETFEYLRYRDDGVPAAGTFDRWPDKVAEVTMMDPCGGSGHFVVAAFEMLCRMRMEEEGLSAAEAGDAVIRDNVHMLELDLRCTQIAAFNIALAAWKAGGYRELRLPNIACSGVPVQGQLKDWIKLAGKDEALKQTMTHLYHLFRNAPDLGSLINPAHIPVEDRMFVSDYERVEPLLQRALTDGNFQEDPAASLFGSAVASAARSAGLLSDTYTLVATNVPYLNFSKQAETLQIFCESNYPRSKRDLATVFLERCGEFAAAGGTLALLTPQNWLFLGSYQTLRRRVLHRLACLHVAWLGPGAFRTISGEVVKPAMIVLDNRQPERDQLLTGIDASRFATASEKARHLLTGALVLTEQSSHLTNPDVRIIVRDVDQNLPFLIEFADSYEGIGTGDLVRFSRHWWEVPYGNSAWELLRGTTSKTGCCGGLDSVILWENGEGDLLRLAEELDSRPTRGDKAWGKRGIAINRMGDLYAEVYRGEIFDCNIAAVIPNYPCHLEAIWHYCGSAQYVKDVRLVDRSLKVTNRTLLKVPFDLEYWQEVANEAGALPEPHSDDPTQWPFEGNPAGSTAPLQVAVARLTGFNWPEQGDDDMSPLADDDGIVCIPPVVGEVAAAERLRTLLANAYGAEWNLELQRKLLVNVNFSGKGLDDWLRDGFFRQHCKLFKNRPFIWHIWDGRRDGFSALVNYHKLDHARLERLIYTYLGDWVRTQQAEQEQGVSGADGRLVAVLELKEKLEAILEGKPPCDIYVRWKSLHEQPIGWNPDLNDSVRLNIRPFVKAGVLRRKFNVHWKKDRGKNPDGSERINDPHFTRAEKLQARKAAGREG